jgi:glucose-6-phosphate 1-epimerase
MIKVYEYSRQPHFWVIEDQDGYWLVPVRPGGWHERMPYVGRTASLREADDPVLLERVLSSSPGDAT